MSAPSRAVTSLSLRVITSEIFTSMRGSNRTSRLVTMPTSSRPETTGTPEMLCSLVSFSSSPTVRSGVIVIGSRMMPLSNFFTERTSRACCSIVMFLCTMPMPPSCAIATARRASVTVSIAADINGMFNVIVRVRRVLRSTSEGRTWDRAGSSKTSSKVSASFVIRNMGEASCAKLNARSYSSIDGL